MMFWEILCKHQATYESKQHLNPVNRLSPSGPQILYFTLSAILLLPVDQLRPQLVMWDTCMCDLLHSPTVLSPHMSVLVQHRHHVLYAAWPHAAGSPKKMMRGVWWCNSAEVIMAVLNIAVKILDWSHIPNCISVCNIPQPPKYPIRQIFVVKEFQCNFVVLL